MDIFFQHSTHQQKLACFNIVSIVLEKKLRISIQNAAKNVTQTKFDDDKKVKGFFSSSNYSILKYMPRYQLSRQNQSFMEIFFT